MRRFRHTAAMGALVLGLNCLPTPVLADSDVLLPPDVTPAPASAPSTGSADQVLLPPDSAETQPQQSSPGKPVISGGYTAIPVQPPPASGQQPPATQVIRLPAAHMPDNASVEALFPNTLNVEVANNSTWGTLDTSLIKNSLGIPVEQISKICSMSAMGMVQTNAIPRSFDIGTSPQALVHYSGKITDISVMMRALCNMVPLPPNSGAVIQMGDKYAVFAGTTKCPPPQGDVRNLIIQYMGNGKAQCQYQ